MSASNAQLILNHLVSSPLLNSETLNKLNPTQFIDAVNKELGQHAHANKVDVGKIRRLEESTLVELLKQTESKEHIHLIMRHGEQDPGPEFKSLSAEDKKIAMMQTGHNESDEITPLSALEFYRTMATLAYIKAQSGYSISIESSGNKRASLPASALAEALNAPISFNSRWDCVNYPSNEQLNKENRRDHLVNGALPWIPKAVNAIIGNGTYERIVSSMQEVLKTPKQSAHISIVFTHTQQTQACCQLLGLEAKRLSNYGFIDITGTNDAKLVSNGFYQVNQTPAPSRSPGTLYSTASKDAQAHQPKEEETKLELKK
jgi:hypothetical protein